MRQYQVSGSEGHYEKDTVKQILVNKLEFTTSDKTDEPEFVLLEHLYWPIFKNCYQKNNSV